MSDIAATKNRWGDPPLVLRGRLSRLALWAIALASVAALASLGCILLSAVQGDWRPLAGLLVFLLTFALLPAIPANFVLAYIMLCTCRPAGPCAGRGLAWAALGLGYLALAGRMALASTEFTPASYCMPFVLALGLLHLALFAAESEFARQSVVALFIGGTCLSLMILWIHHSREVSRRLLCVDQLRKLGLQQSELLRAAPDWRTAKPTADLRLEQGFMAPSIPQWMHESAAPASNRHTIPAHLTGDGALPAGVRKSGNSFVENEVP